jgi:hypothetical protein
MSWLVYAVVAIALVIAVYFVARVLVHARRLREPMLVDCPENHEVAAVKLDPALATRAAAFGHAELQLSQCSRWPERQACGQECLKQIETQPEDCMLRAAVTKWYEGKSCVMCGKPLGAIDWLQHRPAIMGPDNRTAEWFDVTLEQLPKVFSTHKPVCWDCHIAETFRQQRPDLVIDNPWRGAGTRAAR